MVDRALVRAAFMNHLFQSIRNEASMGRTTHPPTQDAAGISADDESDMDEASPCGDIGEFRHPQHVRRGHP